MRQLYIIDVKLGAIIKQIEITKGGEYVFFSLTSLRLLDGRFLARLLILIKKGGLLQLKFGVVGVGVGVVVGAIT